jgi:hypothetical protein
MGNGEEGLIFGTLNPEDQVAVDEVGNHLPVTNEQV